MSMKFNTCHFASARRAWWISRSLLVWLYARYCTRHGWRFHSGITGYNRRYSVEKIENSTDVTGFHTNVGAPREAAMTALTTMNIPAAQRAFEVLPKWLELDFVKQLWVGNESIISSRIFWIIRMNEWMNEWILMLIQFVCNSIIMNLLLSKHLMCFCDMMQLQCPVGSSHRRYWHVKAMAWDHLWPALSRDLKGSAWRCNFLGGSASEKLARWLLLLVAGDMNSNVVSTIHITTNFNDLRQHRIVGYYWILDYS